LEKGSDYLFISLFMSKYVLLSVGRYGPESKSRGQERRIGNKQKAHLSRAVFCSVTARKYLRF